MRSSARYSASEGAIGSLLVLGLGLLLTGAFGALAVDAALDLCAFPPEPRPMTVREASLLAEPPRGTWVQLTDARLDCTHPPRPGASGSNVYGFVTDASGSKVLVSIEGPVPETCEAWPLQTIGVLSPRKPGEIVGVDWPGLDWRSWPTSHLAVLWTDSGPSDSRYGVWLFPLLMLPGLGMVIGGGMGLADYRANVRAWAASRGHAPAIARTALAMPLSTGASVLTVFGVAVGAFQILTFGPLFVAEHLPGWMTLPLGILAALWFFAVVGSLIDAWKRRASDLVLAPAGYHVRGGPLHGAWRPWREVDPARTELLEKDTKELEERATLVLDGEVAAGAVDEGEVPSLRAVAETVRALAHQATQRVRTRRGPRGAVHCPTCGAPVALVASQTLSCRSCDGTFELPPEARRQLEALEAREDARKQTERLLARLLRQPGAHATNVLVFAALPPLLLGWPLAAIFYDELHQTRHVLGWQDGLALFAAAFAFTYGLSWLVRAQVVGREAIRLIATRFAALPPEVEGDPPSCRECGALLPLAKDDALVAICAYCEAENLLGINLVPAAKREVHQARDLDRELTRRLVKRRRLRLVSLGSALLLAGSILVLYLRLAPRL